MVENDTKKLWLKLKKMGSFSDSYYDKSIIEDLKQELGIKGNFETRLQDISPEQFLSAFFNVLKPFVSMYGDILKLFEQCKATSGQDNIEIEFSLDEFKSECFNAEYFIDAEDRIAEVEKIRQGYHEVILSKKGIKILWDLSGGENLKDSIVENASFLEWEEEYKKKPEQWPAVKLDFLDLIEGLLIKEDLHKVYLFWCEMNECCKLIPRRYKQQCDYLDKNPDNVDSVQLWVIQQEEYECIKLSLKKIYYLAENYGSFPTWKKESIDSKLAEFSEEFILREIYLDEIVDKWKDILKLPVWKRRYELYFIWVFAQMMDGPLGRLVKFDVKDGKLVFPFKATRLATLQLNGKYFQFWTEMRSETIIKPIGGGRVKGIQSDYSIICGDVEDIRDSIAVVECKQYKKSNTKNFSQAIRDYALNRPKAKVLLADYGEINKEKVKNALEMLTDDRYMLLSKCRPGGESDVRLKEQVWELVCQHAGVWRVNRTDSVCISLRWNEEPKDLDLHLEYRPYEEKITERVNYKFGEISDVEFGGDIISGYGPEWIYISQLQDGIYDLWVHNYSGECGISGSNVNIVILRWELKPKSDQVFKVVCSKDGEGRWWHVLRIDVRLGIVEVVDEYEDRDE